MRLVGRLRQGLYLLVLSLVAILVVIVCLTQRENIVDWPSPIQRILWPYVASEVAERQFEAGMLSSAAASALDAIRHKPGDVVAIRVLALVDEQTGRPQQAAALMGVGTRWSWRDTPTQIWLFRKLRDSGEYEAAIIHGEALVARQQDEEEVFGAFSRLTADPRNIPPLVEAITRGASWRQRFYEYLGNAPPEVQLSLAHLLVKLSLTSAPPAESDWEPLLRAMLQSSNARRARALWLSLFRKTAGAGAILDPSFDELPLMHELGTGSGLFDWRFDPTAEIYAVPDTNRANSKALYIARAGVAHEPLVQQIMTLSEGAYELSFRLQTESPEAQSLVRVGVGCGRNNQEISEPHDLPPWSHGWRTTHLHFVVGPACTSEQLRVDPVGTRPGQTVGAWIDDFELSLTS